MSEQEPKPGDSAQTSFPQPTKEEIAQLGGGIAPWPSEKGDEGEADNDNVPPEGGK